MSTSSEPPVAPMGKHRHHLPQIIRMKDAHAEHHGGFNRWLAVLITRGLSSMWCAYLFAALALYGFPGLHSTATQYVQWLSQTFIQLTALSILGVGQSVLGKHQELQSEETARQVGQLLRDIEVIRHHLEDRV